MAETSGGTGQGPAPSRVMSSCVHCDEFLPPKRDGTPAPFCMYCGKAQRCTWCRGPLSAGEEVCQKCSNPLAQEAESPAKTDSATASASESAGGQGPTAGDSGKSANKGDDEVSSHPGMNTGNVDSVNSDGNSPKVAHIPGVQAVQPVALDLAKQKASPPSTPVGCTPPASTNEPGQPGRGQPNPEKPAADREKPAADREKPAADREKPAAVAGPDKCDPEKPVAPENPIARDDDVMIVGDPKNAKVDEHKGNAQAVAVDASGPSDTTQGLSGDRSPSSHSADSDESSDQDRFHTPPRDIPTSQGDGKNEPPQGIGGDHASASGSASVTELSLQRLRLDEGNKRKHSLDRDESEDSDVSKPSKRKALEIASSSNLNAPRPAGENVKSGGAKAKDVEHKTGEGQDKGEKDKDSVKGAAHPDGPKGKGDEGTSVDHPLEVSEHHEHEMYTSIYGAILIH